MKSLCLSVAMIIWFASAAHAQQVVDSFEALKRWSSPYETTTVIDSSGHETRGRLAVLSETTLAIGLGMNRRRVFDIVDVRQITQTRRDPVRNGILIGAGAGAVLGFLAGRRLDPSPCRPSIPECGQGAMLGTVGGAFWGSAAGWIVDVLRRKRQVVYVVQPDDEQRLGFEARPSRVMRSAYRAKSPDRTLMATSRGSFGSRARYTSPMPPRPRSATIS